MKEKLELKVKELLEQANRQYEISQMYAKQNRQSEQNYHMGRYTGLRDAATQLELILNG